MKRITRLFFFLVVLASILAAGLVFRNGKGGVVRRVQAGQGCTLATLQGDYLFTSRSDNRSDLPDPGFPTVVVGVRTFDGEGNLSTVLTQSLGVQIAQRLTPTGTYTLDSDCSGTMTIAGARHFDIFVTRDGSEGAGIQTDDGSISTQSFKRRSKSK